MLLCCDHVNTVSTDALAPEAGLGLETPRVTMAVQWPLQAACEEACRFVVWKVFRITIPTYGT